MTISPNNKELEQGFAEIEEQRRQQQERQRQEQARQQRHENAQNLENFWQALRAREEARDNAAVELGREL